MIERQEIIEALNKAFSFKYHSMAGYIEQADPYVAPGREAALELVLTIAAEDRVETDRLARRMESLEGIPQAGSPGLDSASVNYLSIDYLLGVLMKNLECQMAFYESRRDRFSEPVRSDFDRLAITTWHHIEQIHMLMEPGKADG